MNYSLHKKFIILGLLILVESFSQEVKSVNASPLREMNLSPFSVENKQQNKVPDMSFVAPTTKVEADLKGGISEMNAFVGKSQLIRFNEPVKRISITNPSLADIVILSPLEMLLNGKAAGLTSLIIWGETGNPVFFDLNIKNDPTILFKAVKAVYPTEKFNLKFTNSENVILSGKVSSSIVKDKIKSITEAYGYKLVDVSECRTPQIVLEVKIAEASRSFVKDIGHTFGVTNYKDSREIQPTTALANNLGAILGGTGSKGLQATYFNNRGITSVLTLAEQKGQIKILAEPKLVSTNGNKASFNSGQQVPVPSGIGQGGNVSYDYKDTGISVEFTPTIQPESRTILLNIKPEVSEIDSTVTVTNGTSTIYGFKTRKAETTVQLKDGETFVIAGLINRTDNSTKNQIPFWGELPLIGSFFRTTQFRKSETELLIFVTPRIIEPDRSADEV